MLMIINIDPLTLRMQTGKMGVVRRTTAFVEWWIMCDEGFLSVVRSQSES